jgi:hypothetical protein
MYYYNKWMEINKIEKNQKYKNIVENIIFYNYIYVYIFFFLIYRKKIIINVCILYIIYIFL